MEQAEFNEAFRKRTKDVAVRIIQMYAKLPKSDEIRIIGKQLIRSSTSIAANYRAACRARSKAEFGAKMSIVVEKADETLFWMEILEEAGLVPVEKLAGLKKEATEILYVVSKARKNAL
jgi:four helix bundle protein